MGPEDDWVTERGTDGGDSDWRCDMDAAYDGGATASASPASGAVSTGAVR